MLIKIRTDKHIHTTTLTNDIAVKLLTSVIQYTKTGKATDPTKKVFIMSDDRAFTITDDLKVMLFKGFYLVVE